MEASGHALKVVPHPQRVPRSQRGGEVIEPMLSTQWFLKMDGMAAAALDAVHSRQIAIKPARFEKDWDNWLTNSRDWCVSRQLWWGHRIPAWYPIDSVDPVAACGSEGGGPAAAREDPDAPYFVGRTEAEARFSARAAGRDDWATMALAQDDDVLDTWFSSGLWPFASVGWPHAVADPLEAARQAASLEAGASPSLTAEAWEALPDYAKFYPATLLETGYDILFFWVARMAMMGLHLTGKPPFEVVYLHGRVRDDKGAQMSKTRGNVLDPLDTIEAYGVDALRYSLVTGVTPGQDVPLSMDKVEASRNFANKLWNAGRYLLNNLAQVRWGEPLVEAVWGSRLGEPLE